ncbi:serine/threonine protein kinase [Streptomyces griseochromogenes]|uniref:Protein kinase n=1 Tax=Streptomyces griseochromogenes TaxID=68214 RepID=A0A1B1AQY7_9ACTN|nr:protein kinase [Streptomyces griseochromogenes]ANP48989.1 protein kinase [Streptomyces griseochromogenes]MBP2049499.1 serine/threonine protein kinase [Streptomyces griseochromogenes]
MTEAYAVPVPRGYRVGGWEVREPIATGAFGSVYAGRRTGTGDRELPPAAALKFLPTGTGTPRQLAHLRELIEREVDLYRRLRRPRLIRMYETLVVDDPARPELDGATVLVLERAEGSLSALLSASPRPAAGPALLAQICEGLAQLHRAGWVHGDLKPANVLLMADGSARLADFNMAAELEGTHAYTPAFSTPDYTPPELLWAEIGERGRRIRPSADVWAFGVLAHLVLTDSFPLSGVTPTARRDAAAAYARGTDELRLSPELPDAWREIIRDCLARTHAARITTEALLSRVEAAAGTGRSPRLPRLFPRRRRRQAVIAGAAAATAAVAALGYGISTWATDRHDQARDASSAGYGASELRTDKGVPVAYRRLIVNSAHACAQSDVTPALIAAMLKAESNFDPNLSDPGKQEFGIARWTPGVLRWWMREDGVPASATPTPPLSPSVSIPAMGRYLCFIDSHLKDGLRGDKRVLTAAGYRTSYKKVNDAGGVPPKYRAYSARVAHYLKEYTPPGKK